MTATTKRKKDRDAEGKFFLYVAFHSIYSAIVNFFTDD